MKHKIIGILATVMVLVVGLAASVYGSEAPKLRVHQHLTARQPDAGCSCDRSTLCTHLPLVIIDTDNQPIPGAPILPRQDDGVHFTTTAEGEKMLHSSIRVMSDDSHNHHPTDSPDLRSDALIRIRGNSSRYFDKKSYLIRLIDDSGHYQDQEMMGMAPHYEWALYGPFLDKSLIRNYLCYNIAGEIMEYAPNVRFCEVILNGEYMGLYVMTETITNGKNCRLNIAKTAKGMTRSGYLIRQDRGGDTLAGDIDTFLNYSYRNGHSIDIKYPRSGDLTPELARAIEQDVSDFERSLYSYDYDTEDYGYQHDIDIQSFVDYFIINEFTSNYDAGRFSTYMYKDLGGKYRMVIWDFNSAFDNYAELQTDLHKFDLQNATWFYMLTKDDRFTDRCITRYRKLRKGFLSDEYLMNYIDDVVEYLGDSIDRNYSRWSNVLAKDLVQGNHNPHTHEQSIEMLKATILDRGHWMDENIETLRQFSHESKVKKFNH